MWTQARRGTRQPQPTFRLSLPARQILYTQNREPKVSTNRSALSLCPRHKLPNQHVSPKIEDQPFPSTPVPTASKCQRQNQTWRDRQAPCGLQAQIQLRPCGKRVGDPAGGGGEGGVAAAETVRNRQRVGNQQVLLSSRVTWLTDSAAFPTPWRFPCRVYCSWLFCPELHISMLHDFVVKGWVRESVGEGRAERISRS